MPSSDFLYLKQRIESLKTTFLPRRRKAVASNYSRNQIERLHGFILLCHAEIENFIELRAGEIANSAQQKWIKSKKINLVSNSLLLYCKKIERLNDNSDDSGNSLDANVKSAFSSYNTLIQNNHGISIDNLYKMLLPIGFTPTSFNPTFIANINSLSKKRGLVAHKAHKIAVKRPLDPFDERDQIDAIIQDLEKIDSTFDILKNKRT